MPIMEISIVPVGTNTVSVSGYVAKAIQALKKSRKIRYKLTPMGTIVEADSLNKLLETAAMMHRAVFECGAKRLVTAIKIDDRKDKPLSMKGKMASVKKKLKG